MTFYQELQLNQAGSKKMLKTSGTGKEKAYHMLVISCKDCAHNDILLWFCYCF